jgi:hypothetical protein
MMLLNGEIGMWTCTAYATVDEIVYYYATHETDYSDTSANEDNSFRNYIR